MRRGNLRSRLKRRELRRRGWLDALVSRRPAIRMANRARIQDARVLNQLRRGLLGEYPRYGGEDYEGQAACEVE